MIFGAHVDAVIDTNIIVSLLSNQPDEVRRAELYCPHLEGIAFAIAFQTEAELLVQSVAQGWDSAKVAAQLSSYEVVPLSDDLRSCYVPVRAAAIDRNKRKQGPLLAPADGWIATAALMLECPLVTHDRKLAQCPLIAAITERGELDG